MTREELRELRTALGLTQQDLAVALGFCVASVANWESGRRGISPTVEATIRAKAAESSQKNGALPLDNAGERGIIRMASERQT